MQGCRAFERMIKTVLFVLVVTYTHVAVAEMSVGRFINDVKIENNNRDKYVLVYPDQHLDNAPIIVFLSGAGAGTVNDTSRIYKGILRYLASHGYYVIATPHISRFPEVAKSKLEKALTASRRHHPELDFTRLGVMGHSVGGGKAFPVIKHLLEKGYGSNASFVMSIDGWFPFGMKQKDLKNLHTTASIIQFGGSIGTGTDPKIHLTTMNLIPDDNEKAYHVLGNGTDHSYITGDLNNILNKWDLLNPIKSLLDYKFKNDKAQRNFLFSGYANTTKDVLNRVENHKYDDSCNGGKYGAKGDLDSYGNDINYCKPKSYYNPVLAIKSSHFEIIDSTSAYIYFSLNQKAQARIEYGETSNYGHFTTKETSFKYADHRQIIRQLDANTVYHYRVHAYDRNGHEVVSKDKTFRINQQPVLTVKSSSVKVNNDSSVFIYFSLNQKAQARVEYGKTTAYGSFTKKETSFKYADHRQIIRQLDANTVYHYRVHAYDRNGHEVISEDKTFKINQSTLAIKSSAVETINTTSVYIHFNLNEKAQARIEYGETSNYGHFTTKETSFNYDSHRQIIRDLKTNTLYHYRVHAYDRNGVEVISKDQTFMIKQSEGFAYPPETDFKPIPTNMTVAKPNQRGASVIDPEFGTTITRVTDYRVVDKNGSSCTGYTYPKTQSWNADMSLLRVNFKLYDANTLEESPITKGLTCTESYDKLGSPGWAIRWSYKNPNIIYSLGTDFIYQKNTIKGNTVTHKAIKDFSQYGFEKMQLGSNEGNMSYDDRFVIFTAKKPGNDHIFAILLNTETKAVKVKELANTTWKTVFVKEYNGDKYFKRVLYDWITVTPKGDHILENKTINGPLYVDKHLDKAPESGIFMYDMNFENPKRISKQASHGDIGIDSNGDQVWVQFEYGNRAGTWSYNLDTLDDILVGKKLFPYKAGHISCQNYNRPGWCYLSTTSEGRKEVYALKLDGSGKVNRFAQTRYRYSSYGGVSPDGKRIVFQSNWNDGGKPDTFHAVLKTANAALNTKVLYEDAEDENTHGWKVYDQTPAGATISNVYDADKGSQVIKLQGSATSNGYKLGGNWKNSERKTIQWKMKYDESYVVYISVKTSKGHRYIYYTATDNDRGYDGGYYIHHGLGSFTTDGAWRVFSRNLEADLKDYENDNELISINGFLIRGSGLVDDIQLLQ